MSKINGLSLTAGFALTFFVIVGSGQVAPKPEPTKPVPTFAQTADPAIELVNEIGQKTNLVRAELSKLPRVTVKATEHGTATTFEGVSFVEVLKLGGVEFGEKLRGNRLASYVLVEAADKYQVVFSLAELDPGFTDKVVILADKRDGKPLPENAREWQIVVPDEKRPGRWIRQVVGLKIILVAPLR